MKIRVSPKEGFTLIELLVVISIIAILAGIALPAFTQVIERGNQTKALSNAKQIYLGLKMYAGDNDGSFPNRVKNASGGFDNTALTTGNRSNDAFKALVPEYIQGENIFYLAKSKWCNPGPPDENTAATANVLTAGENHWAYVLNLTDTSNPSFPLIADGFSNTVGVYTRDETAPGGVWKGKAAIVVRVDGSGRVEKVRSSDFKVVGPVGNANGSEDDIFATSHANWLSSTQAPINPLAPATP